MRRNCCPHRIRNSDSLCMSIRDWPVGERPREKLLSAGSASLSDAELLAVLLGSGARGKDAIALGRELLMQAGSLSALLGQADHDVRAIGLGPAKRARILASLELARRCLAEPLIERTSLSNPRDSGQYLAAKLRHLPYEVFVCLYLDNRHRVHRIRRTFSRHRRWGQRPPPRSRACMLETQRLRRNFRA